MLSVEELGMLQKSVNPVDRQLQRIFRAITTRHRAGGVHVPPPVYSRIFQELSTGMLAFNQASKLKEVQMPFSYVQFNAVLNMLFIVAAPIGVSCFTKQVWFSVVSSMVIVGAFTALFILANEMEDPFGSDENDMPMLSYHENFCRGLHDMLTMPWMPDDAWIVADGAWQPPDKDWGDPNLTMYGDEPQGQFSAVSTVTWRSKQTDHPKERGGSNGTAGGAAAECNPGTSKECPPSPGTSPGTKPGTKPVTQHHSVKFKEALEA